MVFRLRCQWSPDVVTRRIQAADEKLPGKETQDCPAIHALSVFEVHHLATRLAAKDFHLFAPCDTSRWSYAVTCCFGVVRVSVSVACILFRLMTAADKII
jgi:hypothetical protein